MSLTLTPVEAMYYTQGTLKKRPLGKVLQNRSAGSAQYLELREESMAPLRAVLELWASGGWV